ncbi:cytoplasmic protein [Bacillus freudenreichii]|nr:cytoplasmic protein [Bacillus freudenreichii]
MSTCQRLANIIGGEVITAAPVCVIQRLRNINASILNRRTRSPLALPFALSFENNQGGRTLNLGETVILQSEINRFMTALRKRGLIVTAVHNHWLFDSPRLMYMHWENVGNPFEFTHKSFEAAKEAGLFNHKH